MFQYINELGEVGDDLVLAVGLNQVKIVNYQGMQLSSPIILDVRGPKAILSTASKNQQVLVELFKDAKEIDASAPWFQVARKAEQRQPAKQLRYGPLEWLKRAFRKGSR